MKRSSHVHGQHPRSQRSLRTSQKRHAIGLLDELNVVFSSCIWLRMMSFNTFPNYMAFMGAAYEHAWSVIRLY